MMGFEAGRFEHSIEAHHGFDVPFVTDAGRGILDLRIEVRGCIRERDHELRGIDLDPFNFDGREVFKVAGFAAAGGCEGEHQ